MNVYQIFPKKRKFFLSNFNITLNLVIINIFFFFLSIIVVSINPSLIKYLALQPVSFIHGQYLWTILTSMFSHVFLWHIFANMITLIFIGGFVEKIIGKKRYLWFYLTSGIIASLFFIFLSVLFGNSLIGEKLFGSPEIFALGASGAIFGLAGLITILIPKMKVLVFFIIPMPIWAAMVFFLGFFWFLSVFGGLPIGNSAHLGGFLTGVVYGLYLKNKFPRRTQIINRYFNQ
jgi:uncharacterized protein